MLRSGLLAHWWPGRKRSFRHARRVLKTKDEPSSFLFLQNLELRALFWFWNVGRRFGAGHGPLNMRDRDVGFDEFHTDVSNGQFALFEYERKRRFQLGFDFFLVFPPPANYVHHFAIFGKEAGVGSRVMFIQRRRLPVLKRFDFRFIPGLRRTDHARQGENDC